MLKWPETYGKSKPLDVGASSMTDASSKSIWQRSVEKLRSRDRLPSADIWEAGVGRNIWLEGTKMQSLSVKYMYFDHGRNSGF